MPRRFNRAPHQLMRYAPVLRLLRGLPEGGRVLEVGSGSEGVGTWWRRPFVGVDLHFPDRIAGPILPVYGDATRLPFPDQSFDLVICVGVLHFLEGSLEAALNEIGRVTRRRALAAAPCAPEATESDRRNLAWARSRGIRPAAWFLEQQERGLPTAEAIRSALARHGSVREGVSISTAWNERFFRAEQRMRRVRGMMTAIQPALRAWGRLGPRERPGGGPPYERWFLLDTHATASPPR